MKLFAAFSLLFLLVATGFGAVPTTTDFNNTQFGTANNKITLKDGVITTNLTETTKISLVNTSLNSGTGSPEGVVTANIGSLYLRRDGTANNTLYVKESGTGNTGWVVYEAGGSGATINPSNGFLPYRQSGTAFGDSPISRIDGTSISIGTLTNIIFSSGNSLVYTNSDGLSAVNFYVRGGAGADARLFSGTGGAVGLSAEGSTGVRVDLTTPAGTALWWLKQFSAAQSASDLGRSAQPWQDLYLGRRIVWDGVANSIWDLTGTGTPEGAVTAGVGSIYRRLNGGTGTTLYVKETGTGNTGWVAHGGSVGGGPPGTIVGFQIVGAGTDHNLLNPFSKVDFGTTDPTFVLTNAGTHQIIVTVGAFANNTFGQRFYLTNVTDGVMLPGSLHEIGVSSLEAPLVIAVQYTTAGANKTIELWGETYDLTYAGAPKVISTKTVVNVMLLHSTAAGSDGLIALNGLTPASQAFSSTDLTIGSSVDTHTFTIANDAVTYAKMQNVSAASRLLGRGSAGGAGDPEEITLGSNLTMTGTSLAATDTGITQLAGDVVAGPGSGSQAATIQADAVALGTDTTGNYVATIAGTANQVNVSGSGSETAAVTLSTPQDIHTGATPQFARGGYGQAASGTDILSITSGAGAKGLVIAGGTQTASTPVIDATQTWNNSGTAFTGLKLNVTDTASAAASLFFDFQAGGSTRFAASKAGIIHLNNGGGWNWEIRPLTGALDFFVPGSTRASIVSTGVRLPSANSLDWNNDLFLLRGAANTLYQRNGANAQTIWLAETFTDGSNYERGSLAAASDTFTIAWESAGTGSANGSVALTAKGTGNVIKNTGGLAQNVSGTAFTQTADKTVANTVTETSLVGTGVGTVTFPANFFTAGKMARFRLSGKFGSHSAAPTLTLKTKLGSTTLATSAAASIPASLTDMGWTIDGDITCRTTGASGTVVITGAFTFGDTSFFSYYTGLVNSTAAVTIDTTASQAFDVTATWSGANAANTITTQNFALQVLN